MNRNIRRIRVYLKNNESKQRKKSLQEQGINCDIMDIDVIKEKTVNSFLVVE